MNFSNNNAPEFTSNGCRVVTSDLEVAHTEDVLKSSIKDMGAFTVALKATMGNRDKIANLIKEVKEISPRPYWVGFCIRTFEM